MKFEFKGGRELQRKLRELDITQGRKKAIARRALDKAAVPIHQAWRDGVDVQSGTLKRSIKIGSRASTRGSRKFSKSTGGDLVERFVGIDPKEDPDGQVIIYAFIEEFGNDRQPANPAGRAAFEGRKEEALGLIAKTLGDEIAKIARREAAKR